MMKPTTLSCRHSGCMKCLRSIVSLGDNVTSSAAPCPICRKLFFCDQLQININLDKLCKSVRMKCSIVKCPHNDCDHVTVREEMKAHCINCEQKKITCHGCKKEIKKGGLAQHQATECYYSQVECPLGCGNNLPR